MTESLTLDRRNLPGEIQHYIYLINGISTKQTYLPLMDLDDMRIRNKDFVEVSGSDQKLLILMFLG